MIRAAVDLGTNTCLLLIAEIKMGKSLEINRVLCDESSLVRLGEGVDQLHRFKEEAMDRTLEALKRYADRVRALGIAPQDVQCVATSQARDAENSSEFFGRVQKEAGFLFKTISGEEEARLTFEGAMSGLAPQERQGPCYVLDIGGGSTELISGQETSSIDIGSVRFTERYLKSNPVTDQEFWNCQNAIDSALEKWQARDILPKDRPIVAVAGTATTLAAWFLDLKKFDAAQVDGTVLTCGDVHRLVEELKWRSIEERRLLPSMEPLRADVILAGALILWRLMEILGFSKCQVSTRGLRYGVLSQGKTSAP